MSFRIVTTSRSLARELWRYGEEALAERAAVLSVERVAEIGQRAGALVDDSRLANAIWQGLPSVRGHLVLATIEALEGSLRAPTRRRRRPEKDLPAKLVATKDGLWADPTIHEVAGAREDRHRRSN